MNLISLLSLICLVLVIGHVGFNPKGKKLRKIGFFHYISHWLFAFIEPLVLKLVDWLMLKRFFTENRVGKAILFVIAKLSWALPHGIVVTPDAAERVVDYINAHEVPNGARFAIGPCICQESMNRHKEPTRKCIMLLYATDIFISLKRGFTMVSAEEVKEVLKNCHSVGLVHELDMCMQSGRWTFCICNCEKDICALTRAYLHTGLMLWPGPEIVVHNEDRCVGIDECGRCIERCIFDANLVVNGKVTLDERKCLGCGLCVSTCIGNARQMIRRENYRETLVPAEILLGREHQSVSDYR